MNLSGENSGVSILFDSNCNDTSVGKLDPERLKNSHFSFRKQIVLIFALLNIDEEQ